MLQNLICHCQHISEKSLTNHSIVRTNQLGPIYNICYDSLTIMPELRSTYDRRLIYKTSYEGRKVRFTCKVVRSSETVFAKKLAYDIPKRNFSTF